MLNNTTCNRRKFRRQTERRVNPHPFNSEGWIAFMQQHYHMWPKQDRRHQDRRSADRRDSRNLLPPMTFKPRPSPLSNQLFAARDLLSDDEKQMIVQLFAEEI